MSLKALDAWTSIKAKAKGIERKVDKKFWASNLVYGIGLGAGSALYGIGHGITGVFYEPYKGGKKKGFVGGMIGVGKGLGGLIYRPVRGGVLALA